MMALTMKCSQKVDRTRWWAETHFITQQLSRSLENQEQENSHDSEKERKVPFWFTSWFILQETVQRSLPTASHHPWECNRLNSCYSNSAEPKSLTFYFRLNNNTNSPGATMKPLFFFSSYIYKQEQMHDSYS